MGAWIISPSLAGRYHFFDPGRDLSECQVRNAWGAPIGTNNDFEVMLRVRASHALFWYLDNLAVARWNISCFDPGRGLITLRIEMPGGTYRDK